MIKKCCTWFLLVLLSAGISPSYSQQASRYDLSRTPVLYTVGYSHLDTEWRWDYAETINDFIPATMHENFGLFEKYPAYVFSFTGARRYRIMKEYYPEDYLEMKKWIIRDRWFVSGSSVDECDPNVPSPESIIRQVLYGNNYFRKEFGKESVDFMLPDCFGFQAHFPSVLAHCGLKGFSTQKLSWGSAVGIPFNLGRWIGPDGEALTSALNATSYTSRIEPRLDTVSYWVNRVTDNGKKYGVYADFRYYGVGDVGGAPREGDVKNAVESLNHPDSRIQVYLSSSDQLFRDLKPELAQQLPEYKGDLLLTEHSAGSITSQAYMKRWNRKNELLASAAEPLAVLANHLGVIPYPKERLNEAWWLVLGSQMHDILPGTSLPSAYPYAWNDEVLAMNLFASVLESSAGAVTGKMDTRGKGIPVVVYNPVPQSREDVVEITLDWPGGVPDVINVWDPSGNEVPSQIASRTKTSVTILFLAQVPSLGLKVFDIAEGDKPYPEFTGLRVGRLSVENDYYRILINTDGDIHSIVDKQLDKELLAGNARLEFLKEHPKYWPAWNMDWSDRQLPPVGYVTGPATTTLVENGPVRITWKVERESRHSRFTQWIQLTSGESGKRILIHNQVTWRSRGVSLKASFPLTAKNELATYNLGFGTIERPSNEPKKYEVPSREWFDLTDASGKWGVTILEDCKFGSDKPNDSTLRLTLLYTPLSNEYHDQATQDWGIHEFTYGIYSHPGDWRTGLSEWHGKEVNQPLLAFLADPHSGPLGKEVSVASANTPQVSIRAIKQAESSNEIIIRVQELFGKPLHNVMVSLFDSIISVAETDGQEGNTGLRNSLRGPWLIDLQPYEMKSFAIRLATVDSIDHSPIFTQTIPLLFNENILTTDSTRGSASFGSSGVSIPAGLFPETIDIKGIPFQTGGHAPGQMQAISCVGQKISLPGGAGITDIYFLAAAENDTAGLFRIGKEKLTVPIQAFSGNIGQFDSRQWDRHGQLSAIEPGYIKRDEVAWFATHLHNDTANVPYRYAYLFLYRLDVPPDAESLILPENPSIRIFGITVARNPYDDIHVLTPLYDTFSGRPRVDITHESHYVTKDLEPLATVAVSREKSVDLLPVKVSTRDFASVLQPHGVTVKYLFTGVPETGSPSPIDKTMQNRAIESSSWKEVPVAAVTDGMFDLLPADSARDMWYDQGEGRLAVDLQHPVTIDSLHLFTSLDLDRGAQSFSLWGYNGTEPPDFTDLPEENWEFIAMIRPIDLWSGGKAVWRILAEKPLTFRYLLFVSNHSGHGPVYFREMDVWGRGK